MRAVSCTILLALSLSPVLLSQTTAAQSAKVPVRRSAVATASATSTHAAVVPVAATSAATPTCPCPTSTVQRHLLPYTAKQQITRVQTLADGTRITHVEQAVVARDADGRTRNESTRTQSDGTQIRSININDPVARVRLSWIDGPAYSKVVNVYHYDAQPSTPVAANPTAAQAAHRYYPYRNESLPPQTIHDTYVEGYRYTRTTPAGYDGNDHDITVTNEYWTAPSLGIQMLQIMDDPRYGKTTTETTDIQQTAPDPALFQAPQGYQTKDTNQ
jgi:hypothetical protein